MAPMHENIKILILTNKLSNEDSRLLGCSAVYSGRSLPTFQRSLLPHRPDDGGQKTAIFVLIAVRTSNPI
jgi:hypothetical protein